MTNIENGELSKDIILGENFGPKIQKLVNDVNHKISTINDDEKNIYIKKTFIKLWRLLKSKENNGINSEEFNKILLFIGHIFSIFDVNKIYNLDTINGLNDFLKLNTVDKFLHNIMPNNGELLDGKTIGGTCNSWSILLFELLNEINIKNKNILKYGGNYRHSSCLFEINGKYFLIDPFCKKQNIVNEIEIGSQIYIGSNNGDILYGKVKSINPFLIDYNGKEISCDKYNDPCDFINELKAPENFIEQIRVYRKGTKIDFVLFLSMDKSSMIIDLNGKRKTLNTQMTKIDIKYLDTTSTMFDILSLLFKGIDLTQEDIKNLETVSNMINKNNLISSINKINLD